MCSLGRVNRLIVCNFLVIDFGSSTIFFRELTRDLVPGTRLNPPLHNLTV